MTGRASKALDAAIARTLGVLRVFGVVHAAVAFAVWHSWYATPTHLVVPLIAAGWAALFAVHCFRVGLTRRLVVGDFAVSMLLAASAAQSLAPDAVERGPNWLLVRLIGTSVAVAWLAPVRLWLSATVALAAAVAASYLVAGVAAGGALRAFGLVVVASVLLATAAKVPRRGAAEADAALARAGVRRHAQSVAALRRRDRRDDERILHDTVLNTLTGLGWGASGPGSSAEAVRARCRQSVALCTDFLVNEGELDSQAGLAQRLDEVAEHARRDGLHVDVSTTGELAVPARVTGALTAAVRESLSNVRRHSGTSRAWVEVRGHGGEVSLSVRDEGVGFDPLTTAPDRLGLRNSIVGRIADVGGSVDVRSEPGRGATVVARWSPHPAPDAATIAQTTLLDAAYTRDARRAVGLAALFGQLVLGVVLAWRIDRYERPLLVCGAWGLSLLALVWCVVVALRESAPPHGSGTGRQWGAAVVAVTAAVVAAQLTAGFTAAYGDLVVLAWVVILPAGPVCFVSVTHPVRHWLPAVSVMIGTAVAVAVARHDPTATVVGRAAGPLYILVALQTALTMFWRSRRATIGVTVRAAQAEVDLAAERAAAVAARHERAARLHQLASGPLPVLTDLGAGRLHPADPTVRRECAALASALRRALSRAQPPPSDAPGLLAALEPAVLAAEQRGTHVEVQVSGDGAAMPADLEREVCQAVEGVLAPVAGGRLLLTVLAEQDSGSVIVSYPTTARTARPAATALGDGAVGWRVDLTWDVEDGQECVEVRWESADRSLARVRP